MLRRPAHEKKLARSCINGLVRPSVADPFTKEELMNRLAQRIRSNGVVRAIVMLATLATVWMAAGAPFVGAF